MDRARKHCLLQGRDSRGGPANPGATELPRRAGLTRPMERPVLTVQMTSPSALGAIFSSLLDTAS